MKRKANRQLLRIGRNGGLDVTPVDKPVDYARTERARDADSDFQRERQRLIGREVCGGGYRVHLKPLGGDNY